ncbi:MAG TPA: ATP-binding protein, partial [Aquabacterium sp.]|nr:ATP-binding protein [Aquabacterium sp.]
MDLEFASLRVKATIYNLVALAVMAIFLLLAGYALYVVRINGPLYQEIRREHDLIADALPPSLYIVDSHLDVTDALLAAEQEEFDRSAALLKRALGARSRYEQKVALWARQIDVVEIKDAFTEVAAAPARRYFTILEQALVPAIEHRDVVRARRVYEDDLVPLFLKHRQAIERATDLAKAEGRRVENDAASTVSWISYGIGLCAAGLAFLWWWGGQRWWVRPLSRRVADVRQALHRIGDGDYESIVRPGVDDEFGEILDSIEAMRSRLHQAVRELDEKRLGALAAERAKSQFLANMSHEIRTPINAILGMTELALRTNLDTKQRGYLTRSHEAGRALLALIDQVLDWSKIEAGALSIESQPFELEMVLTRVSSIVQDKAVSKGLAWSVELDPTLKGVWIGDAHRLAQVLINLTNNAVKFTERGRVQLIVRSVRCSDRACLIRFSVNDTGIGMTVAQQSRVFRPFAQADVSMTRRYGGTGLGLVISQQLIELLGGELKLESAPGKGSHFSFDLSLVRAADNVTTAFSAIGADPQQVHAVAMSWPELKERSVLLVEDNEFNQLVASELL